ncbi:MAG: helix-turn-helix domain-containing protein [Spirochaetales bacterium]|nr:helix-turn-helix domain-containing protein [Spirochaetales bacterium]
MTEESFGKRILYYRKQTGLTQGDLGKRLGVSQVTIAHYEKGRRFPGKETLTDLASVLGVSLDTLLNRKESLSSEEGVFSPEELIQILLEEPMERGWIYLRKWQSARNLTVQAIFTGILIPLLRRVGDMWFEREIFISQEHLVSEKVRNLIDRLTRDEMERKGLVPDKSKRWMGVCAPGEKHELVLTMCSCLMSLAGWDVRYLGRDVPLSDLKLMIKRYKPRMLVFSITMKENQNGLGAYLANLSGSTGKRLTVLGGAGCDADFLTALGKAGEEVIFTESLEDYLPLIEGEREETEES